MYSPLIGAYWPSRKETKEQCAERAAIFFDLIRSYPDLTPWFAKGKSAKAALKFPVQTSIDGILPFFRTNNRDTDHSPIVDLGFHLDLWNGDSVSLSICCGSFSPYISNFVLIEFADTPEVGSHGLVKMRSLLEVVIDIWEPDHAIAAPSQWILESGTKHPWQTKGWFNFSKSEGIIDNSL
ncbi:Imm52 family immunity protein [Luteolibacter luteus]|uniref:Immunity protein 52 domain-containing protein n=1 Tax=Luteolibacter luteus TaxID=2728835 RepID=A0A858RQW6_9BACT|nr:Imm52 family immunity protein [Luteolibacter luteus]QJE99145.1 hypothetical protein HHL09_26310 [Luteolibacter luteus]